MAVFQVLTTFDVAASAFLTALEGAPAAAPAAPLKKGSAVPPLPSASSARHAQALLSRGRAAAARKASRCGSEPSAGSQAGAVDVHRQE